MTESLLRVCPNCEEEKNAITDFFVKNGSWCKDCIRSPDQKECPTCGIAKHRLKAFYPYGYSRCKACATKYARNYHLKNQYGITAEEYGELLESQEGVCAVCGCEPNGKNLAVDHCHQTGVVRGLLCNTCNLGLGALGDNEEGLTKAIEYLSKQNTLQRRVA